MRQKRAKNYKKQMQNYHLNFKFREPYQVLVDHELIIECVDHKYDLVAGLQRTLQSKEVKPMITQHSLQVLFDSKNEEAIQLGKSFERRRTLHFENSAETREQKLKFNGANAAERMHPSEAIFKSVVVDGSNVHRYVVAAQDKGLRGRLRKIPGVPLIHMTRVVMLLEPFSEASERACQLIEQAKLTGGLNAVKRKAAEVTAEGEEPKKVRKGPKQPNSLSVKKKKVTKEHTGKRHRDDGEEEAGEGEAVKKVRRKRAKKKDDGEAKEDEDAEVKEVKEVKESKSEPKEVKESKEDKEVKETKEAQDESKSEVKEATEPKTETQETEAKDIPADDEE